MAGLIQNNFSGTSNRVPFWGDLPIIGRTGGVDSLSSGEQELVVLVTPVLVHPLDMCKTPPLPGNDIFEPGDVEFYLLGHLEGRRTRGLPGFGPHRLRPPEALLRLQRPVHHRPARHDLRLLQIWEIAHVRPPAVGNPAAEPVPAPGRARAPERFNRPTPLA